MVSDQQSIPQFRRHMILELHSQTLLETSPSNIEKDIYCAVDYVNNYFIGRALSAPDQRQFTLFKFLHKIQQTDIKRFDWPKHDDIDNVHSTCVFYGPVELKGTGKFEVLDLQDLEVVFQSLSQWRKKHVLMDKHSNDQCSTSVHSAF